MVPEPPAEPETQVVPMAKQPELILMPLPVKVEVAVPPTFKLVEAWRAPPVTIRPPLTVEEACEMKPPPKVASAPLATVNAAATDEEAVLTKPPLKLSVPVVVKVLLMDEEAKDWKPL